MADRQGKSCKCLLQLLHTRKQCERHQIKRAEEWHLTRVKHSSMQSF